MHSFPWILGKSSSRFEKRSCLKYWADTAECEWHTGIYKTQCQQLHIPEAVTSRDIYPKASFNVSCYIVNYGRTFPPYETINRTQKYPAQTLLDSRLSTAPALVNSQNAAAFPQLGHVEQTQDQLVPEL